jgi:hypothetical protein
VEEGVEDVGSSMRGESLNIVAGEKKIIFTSQ